MTSADPAAALQDVLRPTRSAPLLVALSGGLDSTVLLHALVQDPHSRVQGLRAVHVDHGLHPSAHEWADHCANFCNSIGVPLTMVKVGVERDGGEGLEAAARRARYAAFENLL
ncbi:MAG: ATP-binding protein, partial [Pseudoxanthomonas sp.]